MVLKLLHVSITFGEALLKSVVSRIIFKTFLRKFLLRESSLKATSVTFYAINVGSTSVALCDDGPMCPSEPQQKTSLQVGLSVVLRGCIHTSKEGGFLEEVGQLL